MLQVQRQFPNSRHWLFREPSRGCRTLFWSLSGLLLVGFSSGCSNDSSGSLSTPSTAASSPPPAAPAAGAAGALPAGGPMAGKAGEFPAAGPAGAMPPGDPMARGGAFPAAAPDGAHPAGAYPADARPGNAGAFPAGAQAAADPTGRPFAGGPAGGFPENVPQVPPRPENLSEWKPDDYRSALLQRDPRLVEAINAHVEAHPGDPQVAELLTELLKTIPQMNAIQGNPGQPGGFPVGAPAGAFPAAGQPAAAPAAGAFPGKAGEPGPADRGGVPGRPGAAPAAPGKAGEPFKAADPGKAGTSLPSTKRFGPVAYHPGQDKSVPAIGPTVSFQVRAKKLEAVQLAQAPAERGANAAPDANKGPGPNPPAGRPANAAPADANKGPGPNPPAGRPANAAAADGFPGRAGGPQGRIPGDMPANAGGPGGELPGNLSIEVVADAILNGLVNNGTSEAWATLEQVLKGELETGLSPEFTSDFVINALILNYGGEDHPTYQILDNLASLSRVGLPFGIQGKSKNPLADRIMLKLMSAVPSVMDQLMGLNVPTDTNSPADGFPGGGPQDPQRPFAGAAAGANPAGPAAERAGAGAPAAGRAAADAGGAAAGAGGFRSQENSLKLDMFNQPFVIPEDKLPNVTRLIWSEHFIDLLSGVIEGQTDGSGLISNDVALTLAYSLPFPPVRTALHKNITTHWVDTAENGGIPLAFASIARDPALLVTLKSLVRVAPSNGSNSGQRRASNKSANERAAKEHWFTVTSTAARAIADRMYQAALLNPDTNVDGVSPPIRLHEDANVTAEYLLRWPQDVESRVSGTPVGYLKVHYIRVELDANESSNKEITRNYQNGVKGVKPYDLGNGTKWFDMKPTLGEGKKRTIDIFFSQGGGAIGGDVGGRPGEAPAAAAGRAPAGGPGGGEGGNGVVIEVLSVEVENSKGNSDSKSADEKNGE